MADEPVEAEAPAQEAVQEAPPAEVPQEQPKETPLAQAQKPEKEVVPIPPEIAEIDSVLHDLHIIALACEKSLDATVVLVDQDKVQHSMKTYSKSLAHLPDALQKLHDLRRYFKQVLNHSEDVRKSLVKLRGSEDALSSEEMRVIVACASIKTTVMASIHVLEDVLTHVRLTTQDLISIIIYHRPGFVVYAKETLAKLRVNYVSEVMHGEHHRLRNLRHDLDELYDLDAHVKEVGNAR